MKKVRSVLKVAGKILLSVVSAVAATLIVLTITHQALTALEKRSNPAPGRMVTVNGRRMHVYSEGTGGRRLVLLSGLGTPSPLLDFKPLIEALRGDDTVIVVEGFGYGWSDRTGRLRTVASIVDETRSALILAGLEPPYVLVPHSISGLYALYHANRYPREVEAVVGIDISVLAQYDEVKFGHADSRIDLLRNLGIVRVAAALFPSLAQIPESGGAYSREDLGSIRMVTCWQALNRTVIDEINQVEGNVAAVRGFSFPDALPVLLFVGVQAATEEEKEFLKRWLAWQRDAVRNSACSRVVVLDAGHYLHRTCARQMAEEIHGFLRTMPVRSPEPDD